MAGIPQAERRRKHRTTAQSLEAREVKRRVVWRTYFALRVEHYGIPPDRADKTETALGLLLDFHGRGYLEIVRRIERAFADPERVKAGVTLESILGDWRELAA